MPFFSKFKSKGTQPAKGKGQNDQAEKRPADTQLVKPRWQGSWTSKEVVPEEVEELVHACTAEMKLRGMWRLSRQSVMIWILTKGQPMR